MASMPRIAGLLMAGLPRPVGSIIRSSFLSLPLLSMASYSTYSSASSDQLSTPRSVSPTSMTSRSSTTTLSKRMSLSSRRNTSPFNPMGGVDIEAIENAMKMSALDGLRGYSQDHYGTIKQYRETDYISKNNAGGMQVLREPAWNKGIVVSTVQSFWRQFPFYFDIQFKF